MKTSAYTLRAYSLPCAQYVKPCLVKPSNLGLSDQYDVALFPENVDRLDRRCFKDCINTNIQFHFLIKKRITTFSNKEHNQNCNSSTSPQVLSKAMIYKNTNKC